ncbi:tetratricopeptide repeat protein [Gammaproteobacteria bacterium]|nr:tetratricopeptide repeat protein [Gammaproteobacteria bacterium]
MELTVDQALQQGVAAHKEGKLEEAERLYRAILQSQPTHPDANHNLGVLAVSDNKADAALPLFKVALEANPKIEQFWLSYIDALIKGKQFDNARAVREQAKTQGVAGDKIDAIEAQITTTTTRVNEPKLVVQKKSLTLSEKRKKLAEQKKKKKGEKQNLKGISPSESEIKNLLEHYQNGRYDDAEKLAKSITQEFPEHQFSWTVLGAVLKQTGRVIDSLTVFRKSVKLAPQDAKAHNNLGVTLQELGRLDEAEASYTQAIALKPDFAEAHSNLGNTLKELVRLDEAEASYKQAIALKPDHTKAHSNLGNTLKELGRLDEAEASYAQAIVLKPDYAEAHYNLGITLQELGRLDEAEASYTQAIALKPDYAEAYSNLGITLKELGRLDGAKASYTRAIALKPDYAEAHSNLGNTLKELGRLEEAEASYAQAVALKPDYAKAHSNLGITLQELGRLEEAEASYAQAIALKPDYTEAHNQLLMCLFMQDKKSVFFDELDCLINQDKASAIIGSLTCRSALKYGLEKPNLFCREPLKYVLHTDLNTQYDFEEIFVEKAKSILNENRILNRKQSLLVNGNQTSGNIFDIKNDDTNEIQNIIRIEVEKYRTKYKESEEGLIKKMPAEYSLHGWLISMKSGGNLKPHIHAEGWLSGTIYINVPPKSKAESGNLVVSLGEEGDATDTRINVEKIINVVTGSLVLFPASLTHYTIPFEAEEERIVLAFDVKEK